MSAVLPPTPASVLGSTSLPAWAQVGERRRAHIERVAALLARWTATMAWPQRDTDAARDAALWHDALRDADEAALRDLAGDASSPVDLLHGPAAAVVLLRNGERRADVIDAVRWHTIGFGGWGRVGRALYMADFLEPGRKFAAADRAYLAAQVPNDFDGTFRQVVRMRLEWSLREGKELFPETVALWNAVR